MASVKQFYASIHYKEKLQIDFNCSYMIFCYCSFHVGSGCQEAEAYDAAIQQARDVFDMGLSMGFDMDLLDIGGGFPGHECEGVSFEEVCIETINIYPNKFIQLVLSLPFRYIPKLDSILQLQLSST